MFYILSPKSTPTIVAHNMSTPAIFVLSSSSSISLSEYSYFSTTDMFCPICVIVRLRSDELVIFIFGIIDSTVFLLLV